MQDRHAYLAELYAGKPMESMKIRYHVPDEAFAYINEQLLKGISKPIIALNPVTKRKEKDLKPDTLLTLAKKIKDAGMIPAMIGAGKDCESFYENLPPDRQTGAAESGKQNHHSPTGRPAEKLCRPHQRRHRHSPLCSRLRRSRGRCFLSE